MPSEGTGPRLNAYGKLTVLGLLAAVGTAVAGGPTTLVLGFLATAVLVVAVAMRRTGGRQRPEDPDDGDAGTDETEMKAKAMVGGEGGHG